MARQNPTTLQEKRAALLQLRLRELDQRHPPPLDSGPTSSPVIPLRLGGQLPPLFLVHAVGGSVAPYMGLAALLGDDRPVYALEDPALHGGPTTADNLPGVATEYLAAVRDVQPDGPLHLGGWSAGGAVALEMARQDPDVALVLVLDTGIPDGTQRPDEAQLRAWFADDLAGMGVAPDSEELARRFPVFAANVCAFLAHPQTPVEARVVSLCAQDDSNPDYLDRRRGCSDALRTVPGNHYTMLQPPNIEALAKAVRDSLNEVGAR